MISSSCWIKSTCTDMMIGKAIENRRQNKDIMMMTRKIWREIATKKNERTKRGNETNQSHRPEKSEHRNWSTSSSNLKTQGLILMICCEKRPAPWWCLGRIQSQWWSQSCSRGLWHTRGAQKQQTWRRTRKRRRRWRQGSWSQGTLCTAQAGWWQSIYVLFSINLICDAADIYLIIKSHCE